MTRPESHEDLDAYERRGHNVATIPSTYITKYPSLGQHLLAALAEAERLGLEVNEDMIVIPLTAEELDGKLKDAQRHWDQGKAQYEQYLRDGQWPKYSWMWNAYLTAEGIEIPKKPEDES